MDYGKVANDWPKTMREGWSERNRATFRALAGIVDVEPETSDPSAWAAICRRVEFDFDGYPLRASVDVAEILLSL